MPAEVLIAGRADVRDTSGEFGLDDPGDIATNAGGSVFDGRRSVARISMSFIRRSSWRSCSRR